jgi:peptidoglycan hydrolase-like protein with peptidoglycan-binding domain
MPNLSDNELRALTYYGIGVGTEGGDVAYQLSFCGHDTHQSGVLEPIGNSGYTIGEMQTDFGSHQASANELVDKFENWAKVNHPDWMLKDKKDQFASDLARDARHIRDPNYTADNLKYQQTHHGHQLQTNQLSATGQDIDQTFKEHLNAYLATDEGKSFVHQTDKTQVDLVMRDVASRIEVTDLYKLSSPEDQAKLFSVVGKLYNQGPAYANVVLNGLEQGTIKNYDQVSAEISSFVARDPKHPDMPTYLESGRDAAVKGAELFNSLQSTNERNSMHAPWQAVVGNPLADPTKLGQDTNLPNLPDQYATVKGTFVQPDQGKAMVNALEQGGSYNYGDPSSSHSRGFFADGQNFAQWDKNGEGRAYTNGQWSEFNRSDLSITRNADKTLDLNVTQNGQSQSLVHVTHPTHAVHAAHAQASAQNHGETLREGMHGEDVKKLQTQLSEMGYLPAASAPDGKYGHDTKEAVAAFQRDHGIGVDGKAGSDTWKAIDASLQPLKQDQPGAPVAASSATSAPGVEDPRNPANADHALFNKLKDKFPDASENRLMQFTAACHVNDIDAQNLSKVYFNQTEGKVVFASGGLMPDMAVVDVKQPSPPAAQSTQQIQQHDQQQAQIQAQVTQAIQQSNQQQQGPVLGGPQAPGFGR